MSLSSKVVHGDSTKPLKEQNCEIKKTTEYLKKIEMPGNIVSWRHQTIKNENKTKKNPKAT